MLDIYESKYKTDKIISKYLKLIISYLNILIL